MQKKNLEGPADDWREVGNHELEEEEQLNNDIGGSRLGNPNTN